MANFVLQIVTSNGSAEDWQGEDHRRIENELVR